eukprot:TRINITY_DN10260_c0_g1_i2.p1 TRINITY_DN10260_c0_g1~~TRINITY_DN10260_c0_g1_i2.p1  ORF type:complete len:245 (-),score=28.39 TRINITY_DN10260_c0_g1_i2:107-781(-)
MCIRDSYRCRSILPSTSGPASIVGIAYKVDSMNLVYVAYKLSTYGYIGFSSTRYALLHAIGESQNIVRGSKLLPRGGFIDVNADEQSLEFVFPKEFSNIIVRSRAPMTNAYRVEIPTSFQGKELVLVASNRKHKAEIRVVVPVVPEEVKKEHPQGILFVSIGIIVVILFVLCACVRTLKQRARRERIHELSSDLKQPLILYTPNHIGSFPTDQPMIVSNSYINH